MTIVPIDLVAQLPIRDFDRGASAARERDANHMDLATVSLALVQLEVQPQSTFKAFWKTPVES